MKTRRKFQRIFDRSTSSKQTQGMTSYQMPRNVHHGARTPTTINFQKGAFPRRVTMTNGTVDNYYPNDSGRRGNGYWESCGKTDSTRTMTSSETQGASSWPEGGPFMQNGKSPYRSHSQSSLFSAGQGRPGGGRIVEDLLREQNEIAVFLASSTLRMASVIEKSKGSGDLSEAKRVCDSIKMMVRRHRQQSEILANLAVACNFSAEEQTQTGSHPWEGTPYHKRKSYKFHGKDDITIEHRSKRSRFFSQETDKYDPSEETIAAFQPPELVEIRCTSVDVSRLAEEGPASCSSPDIPEHDSVRLYM